MGSKISVDIDCGHEIKRCLLLVRKVMTSLDSILKSRAITLLTKVCLVKGMVFPVVICGSESWTIKKAESQIIGAFELWCWRRLLRVSWTARRSNQSILKEISSEYSLKGLMLKLAEAPILSPLDGKNWLTGKDADAWNYLRKEEKGMTENGMVGWHHRLKGHELEQVQRVGEVQGSLACCRPWGYKRVRHDWVTELNWMV